MHVVSKTRLQHDGSSGVMSKTCFALGPEDDIVTVEFNVRVQVGPI